MLALGLLIGGVAIGAHQVMARNNSATQSPTTVNQQETQNPSYKGSIAVDEAKTEGQNEQKESQGLAGLAKISADQAKQTAEAQVGGTASSAELDNENGSLVYEVKIGSQEVKVDAGTGAVLKVEQSDNEKSGDTEKGEVSDQSEGGAEQVE